jgi:hypothetical protein
MTVREVYDVLREAVMTLSQKMVTYVSQGEEEGEMETKTTMPLSSYIVREFGESLIAQTNITADDLTTVGVVAGEEVPTGDPHHVLLGFGGGSRRRRTVRRTHNTLHRNVRRHNVK